MHRRESLSAWGFVAFPLAIVAIFTAIPTLAGVALSFFNWSGAGQPQFIGLDNYLAGCTDPDGTLLRATRNTLIFAIVSAPVTVLLAFLLAAAVNAPWFIGRSVTRTILFLPAVISIVAIGFIWRWVLDSQSGLLNYVLVEFGVSRESIPAWLGDSPWGLATIIFVSIWRGVGFSLVLYLAALGDVPRSYYEAAAVDGAGPWQSLWRITWPTVRPMTWFLLITGMIWALQVFDIVLIMIGAIEQRWTDVLNLYLYREFIHNRLGFAAMIAVVVLGLTAVVTAGQLWWWKRFEGADA